jgi:hypothetical protein
VSHGITYITSTSTISSSPTWLVSCFNAERETEWISLLDFEVGHFEHGLEFQYKIKDTEMMVAAGNASRKLDKVF